MTISNFDLIIFCIILFHFSNLYKISKLKWADRKITDLIFLNLSKVSFFMNMESLGTVCHHRTVNTSLLLAHTARHCI